MNKELNALEALSLEDLNTDLGLTNEEELTNGGDSTTNTSNTDNVTEKDTEQALNTTLSEVSPLFAENNFPIDVYGLTSEIKSAYKVLGSRIAGNPEKYDLAKRVLHHLNAFLDAKYNQDAAPKSEVRGVVVVSGGGCE